MGKLARVKNISQSTKYFSFLYRTKLPTSCNQRLSEFFWKDEIDFFDCSTGIFDVSFDNQRT